jgi:hypothetical protein
MAKFPRELLQLWPETSEVVIGLTGVASTRMVVPTDRTAPGSPYRRADENVSTRARQPFSIDPNLVDRGTRGHAKTQNALANWVRALGAQPLSPRGDPPYDLAWRDRGSLYVAEVKSLTERNEERQLRLGLGQLLRYRQALQVVEGGETVAVLMVEREPTDATWADLCEAVGVRLVWPEKLGRVDRL